MKLVLFAEREGFEPSIPLRVYTLSRRAPSATRTPLCVNYESFCESECKEKNYSSRFQIFLNNSQQLKSGSHFTCQRNCQFFPDIIQVLLLPQ